MKNSYIKYFALFIGLILVIDIVGGSLLKTQFQKISFGTYGKINNSLKSNPEILILGSSRAMHHYNSSIFSKNTKLFCYNTGLGGYGLFYNYAILKEKTKSNSLKVVIIDLSPNVIVDDKSYVKLNMLLPYYKEYYSFEEIIRLDSEFSKLELISNMYLYNSTLYDLFKSNIGNKIDDNYGFSPLKGEINKKNFKPFYYQNEKIDQNKFIYLNKIIKICNLNNIKLIGVISPTYLKYDTNNIIINKIKEIFKSNSLKLYDYSIFPKIYGSPKYFKDQLHMNFTGANIFSENLSNKIANGI